MIYRRWKISTTSKSYLLRKMSIKRFAIIICASLVTVYFLYKKTTNRGKYIPLNQQQLISLFTDEKNANKVQENYSNSKTRISNRLTNNFPYEEKCFFESYPNFNPSSTKEDFEFLESEEGIKFKKILFYDGYANGFGFALGHKSFESACCLEKRCFLTNQRSKLPIGDYDAILFDFRELKSTNHIQGRKRNQRWIFYEREPPPMSGKNPEKFDGVFNWTMTYRRDSDVVAPYGRVYSKWMFENKDFSKFPNSSNLDSLLKTKTKLAAWMVSHCVTPSGRDQFVKTLQNYMKIDVYGKCGRLRCDNHQSRAPKCYEMIEKYYKFYLAFENSLCQDYVTEKFFNILNYNVVPVVRGSADFESIAPPHSYIDERDFKTAEGLASYLKYLDGNDTAYLEYLKWKDDYIPLNINSIYHKGSFCDICKKLHSDHDEKIYHNLREWYIDNAKCHSK